MLVGSQLPGQGKAHCPASCAPSDQAAAVLPQRQEAGSLDVEREEAAGLAGWSFSLKQLRQEGICASAQLTDSMQGWW